MDGREVGFGGWILGCWLIFANRVLLLLVGFNGSVIRLFVWMDSGQVICSNELKAVRLTSVDGMTMIYHLLVEGLVNCSSGQGIIELSTVIGEPGYWFQWIIIRMLVLYNLENHDDWIL